MAGITLVTYWDCFGTDSHLVRHCVAAGIGIAIVGSGTFEIATAWITAVRAATIGIFTAPVATTGITTYCLDFGITFARLNCYFNC